MRSRKNVKGAKRAVTNGDDLRRATDWVLAEEMFSNLEVHGNVKWKAMGVSALVRLAIFWMWSAESSIVEAASDAITIVTRIFGSVAVNSYQSLTNALRRYGDQIRPVLTHRLHGLMEKSDKSGFRIGLWLALAVDGSRLDVPRTLKNERQFCKATQKKKSKKSKSRGRHAKSKKAPTHKKKHYNPQPVGPQMWLTLIWHVGQQLPWCWKTGPSYSSERHHVLEMLRKEEFAENTLFCGDAGFVGYDFWHTIHNHGHSFLVRVGGNVRLLKKLGWYTRERNGIVYSWPDSAMKKKQPPLVLRLLQFKDARNGTIYLVTNVLDKRLLPDSQAGQIFRQRWGIEVQFRSLKQTFGRTKLRSGTPENATIELDWSLFALWMVQLLAHKEQARAREPNEKTSIAAVLRTIRRMIQNAADARPSRESLKNQLAEALTDNYDRKAKKKSRNYPRRKEEPATGKPITLNATKKHKQQLDKIAIASSAQSP
jgi:hypothetical protein